MTKLMVAENPKEEVHIVFEGKLDTEILIKLVQRYGDKNKELIIDELKKFLTKGNC
jgi:hypothetical protein